MRRLALIVTLLPLVAARAQYRESIDVTRILVDVRVTDYSGNPITDLTAKDFTVKIGRRDAAVESVTWVSDVAPRTSPAPMSAPSSADAPAAPSSASPGRLIVIFVQTDFARNQPRIFGHLDFLRYAEKMVDAFEARDRIAVFQFDSHLKFRLDFTSDKAAVRAALRRTPFIEKLPPPPAVPAPSLAPKLERKEMERAVSSEAGLRIVASALKPIPGPKTMLLLGWGLGARNANGVHMRYDYAPARQALEASRTTIFALDTTHADSHELAFGLKQAAADTGGFYVQTHVFPQLAIDRVRRTIAGHYELELRRPETLKPGTHAMDVRVARKRVDVLAPSTYMDRR